jgi:hypothetical protein
MLAANGSVIAVPIAASVDAIDRAAQSMQPSGALVPVIDVVVTHIRVNAQKKILGVLAAIRAPIGGVLPKVGSTAFMGIAGKVPGPVAKALRPVDGKASCAAAFRPATRSPARMIRGRTGDKRFEYQRLRRRRIWYSAPRDGLCRNSARFAWHTLWRQFDHRHDPLHSA